MVEAISEDAAKPFRHEMSIISVTALRRGLQLFLCLSSYAFSSFFFCRYLSRFFPVFVETLSVSTYQVMKYNQSYRISVESDSSVDAEPGRRGLPTAYYLYIGQKTMIRGSGGGC